LEDIALKKQQIESDFYEIYNSYSSAQYSDRDALERKMEKLESDFQNILKHEEKLEASLADLEEMVYECLYRFEDAVALTDAYGSDKAQELKSLLDSVYGE
jgi:predicted  nucleic acid-binding Zn-ribbon protein